MTDSLCTFLERSTLPAIVKPIDSTRHRMRKLLDTAFSAFKMDCRQDAGSSEFSDSIHLSFL
jgi:hypothetical protein